MNLDKQVAIIFTLVGIICLSLGMFSFSGYQNLVQTGIKAQAQVVETIYEPGSKGCYEIVLGWRLKNGKYVKHRLSESANFGPREGDKVEIAYDPQHPTTLVMINELRSLFLPLCTGFLGSFFSIFGIGMGLRVVKTRSRNNWLATNGALVAAHFRNLVLDTSRSINGVNPWKVVVCGNDPLTGKEMSFESEPVWQDPTRYLRNCPVDVYVDPNNPSRYYVDLTFLGKRFFDC